MVANSASFPDAPAVMGGCAIGLNVISAPLRVLAKVDFCPTLHACATGGDPGVIVSKSGMLDRFNSTAENPLTIDTSLVVSRLLSPRPYHIPDHAPPARASLNCDGDTIYDKINMCADLLYLLMSFAAASDPALTYHALL